MTGMITTWALALPVGAVIGWFANRLLAPTFDELGARLKGWVMSRFSKDEYSTYVTYSNLHKLIAELHNKGHNAFNSNKPYLDNHEINLEIKSKTSGQLRAVAAMWVRQSRIGSYADSDIYFAGLEILMQHLTKSDTEEMFRKWHDSSQANLWPFLEIAEAKRPELFTAEILDYLRKKQNEWADLVAKREAKKQKNVC